MTLDGFRIANGNYDALGGFRIRPYKALDGFSIMAHIMIQGGFKIQHLYTVYEFGWIQSTACNALSGYSMLWVDLKYGTYVNLDGFRVAYSIYNALGGFSIRLI